MVQVHGSSYITSYRGVLCRIIPALELDHKHQSRFAYVRCELRDAWLFADTAVIRHYRYGFGHPVVTYRSGSSTSTTTQGAASRIRNYASAR